LVFENVKEFALLVVQVVQECFTRNMKALGWLAGKSNELRGLIEDSDGKTLAYDLLRVWQTLSR
jgi:hypothetical protein